MIKLKSVLKEAIDIPRILYHATFEPLVNSIVRNGLIPGGTTYRAFDWADRKSVFLATNPKNARDIVETSDNPKIPKHWKYDIRVLTIDTSKLDKKRFSIDKEGVLQILKMTSYKYAGVIPPQAITDYGD